MPVGAAPIMPPGHYWVNDYFTSGQDALQRCQQVTADLGYTESTVCHGHVVAPGLGVVEAGWICTPRGLGLGCDPKSDSTYWIFYLFDFWFGVPSGKTFGQPSTCFGNPVDAATGNKYQAEHLYSGPSGSLLRFSVFYNSMNLGQRDDLGRFWSRSHGQRLLELPGGKSAAPRLQVHREDGRIVTFIRQTEQGGWVADADVTEQLAPMLDASGAIVGWRFRDANDAIETLDPKGRLLAVATRTGRRLNVSEAGDGVTRHIADEYGRSFSLLRNGLGLITTLVDAGAAAYRLVYSPQTLLASVTFPDGVTRQYRYTDSRYPWALTGIVDENGQAYSEYTYNDQYRASATTYVNGVSGFSLSYSGNETIVIDPLGTTRTYSFQTVNGVVRNSGVSQPGGSGCGPSAASTTYDANGNVATRTDFNGVVTTYQYDLARNLETARTEAAGTPEARTIRTTWHPDWRQPVRIEEPGRTTSWVFNGDGGALCAPPTATVPSIDGGERPIGVVCAKTLSDGAESRTWRWTYNDFGRPLSETPPDGAVTTHDYWPADASCPGADLGPGRDKGCRGELRQTTNPVGHVTRFTRYNAHSQIEETVDPNGLVSRYAYDLRQRLIRAEVGGEVTAYTYDPVGQLIGVTHPDGGTLAYTYDAAHRLVAIADGAGNRIDYTLDAAGNRIGEDVRDASGQLARSISRSYDALGRLQAISGLSGAN